MGLNRIFLDGETYHIFNKSIASFGIFKDLNNCQRFLNVLYYYNHRSVRRSYSEYIKTNKNYFCNSPLIQNSNQYIKFISYCFMPDHYHLLIKILVSGYFSKYISDVENSFTRYFNIKFKRKGPLWQTGFKFVQIRSDEQLLHVSRYIHLNPTTSFLVKKPENWQFSSYKDYIRNPNVLKKFISEISIRRISSYKEFVDSNKDYQRKLKKIKKLINE